MKPKALWDLMRLDHGVMLFVAILIGSIIANSGGAPDLLKLMLSFLTALFLEASTFALNDYIDLEIDRRNKREDGRWYEGTSNRALRWPSFTSSSRSA